MPMKWYVVHTYSGHENKAKLSLLDRVRQAVAQREVRRHPDPDRHRGGAGEGTEAFDDAKFFPGYMFVQMDLDQETFHLVKNTPEDHRLPRRHEPAAGQGDARSRTSTSR